MHLGQENMPEPILTTDHPRAQCVDLRRTFAGCPFKFAWDEAYHVERPDHRRIEAAWLTTLPCRVGTIYPHGGRRLAALCTAGAPTRRALEALACVTVRQGGGPGCPEVTVTFDVADFGTVAAIMQPRRRRRLSPEQRAEASARLQAYKFRPGHKHVRARMGRQESRSARRGG
jgi:hypothetical protein